MEFLTRYGLAVGGCFAVYGVVRCLHQLGQAYWLHCVVKNARGHAAWMQWRGNR